MPHHIDIPAGYDCPEAHNAVSHWQPSDRTPGAMMESALTGKCPCTCRELEDQQQDDTSNVRADQARLPAPERSA